MEWAPYENPIHTKHTEDKITVDAQEHLLSHIITNTAFHSKQKAHEIVCLSEHIAASLMLHTEICKRNPLSTKYKYGRYCSRIQTVGGKSSIWKTSESSANCKTGMPMAPCALRASNAA